jgi:Domain of unknown function (DUF1906)
MKNGFDTPTPVTKFATCLKADGYDFVGRYYNVNNQAKNLSLAEAIAVTSAGLSIIAVWENGFPTAPGYFSFAKGVFDGTSAYHYAQNDIGQPANTPIYFAVDYDATTSDVNNVILDYFNGINSAFNTISSNAPIYQIGVYGSGLVCSTLLNNAAVSFTWLAQSMGWGGSGTFTGYNIIQSLQKTHCAAIGGITGDPDQSPNDNEGSFTITPISQTIS